jgi:hypothetical protein
VDKRLSLPTDSSRSDDVVELYSVSFHFDRVCAIHQLGADLPGCSGISRDVPLAVHDTGAGVSAYELPHMLGSFYRSDDA